MSLINNQTYTGKQAQDWYSAAFLKSVTIDNIAIIPNIKSSYKLNRMNDSSTILENDCTFTDTGSTTLVTNTITVCDFKINREFCKKDFVGTWMEEQMRAGSKGDQVPPSFQDHFLAQLAAQTGQKIEQNIWTASTAASPAAPCDGFLHMMGADSAVIKQTGTTLSESNIVAQLKLLYNKIPATVRNSPKMRIYMGDAAYGYYLLANLSLGTGAGFGVQSTVATTFANIKIVVCPGLSADKMVAAEYDNLVFGTDLVSDFGDIRVIDMEESTGAPNVRFVASFKYGVGYRVSEEVTLYA